MLKAHWRMISRVERACDNAIVIAAFFLTYALRGHFLGFAETLGIRLPQTLLSLGSIANYFIILAIALPLYNAFLSLLGAYNSMRLSSWWKLLQSSALSAGAVFVCTGALLFLLKLDLSRSFIGIFSFLSAVLLFAERFIVLRVLRYFRVRGKNFRNMLIVGTARQARDLYTEILKQPELGMRVRGFVSLGEQVADMRSLREVNGDIISPSIGSQSVVYDLAARVVAGPDTFEHALKRYAIDEVIFTDVATHLSQVQDLAEIAMEEGVRVTLAADIFSLEIRKSDVSYFGRTPLIHYQSSPSDSTSLLFKRGIDFVVSGLALAMIWPFLALVAAMIKLDSPGSVFFRQKRVGLNGRTFVLLKFRSMVKDAEAQLPALQDKNEMKGPVFKIRNDPRVTRVGKFIRRYSIDELPQLINVFRGDMSLVGPRPPLPGEVERYGRKHRRRLSMRPGITCIWQVSGRNDIPDFEEWAKLDLKYIDNWSLKNDFALMLKTIPAVVSGWGAR